MSHPPDRQYDDTAGLARAAMPGRQAVHAAPPPERALIETPPTRVRQLIARTNSLAECTNVLVERLERVSYRLHGPRPSPGAEAHPTEAKPMGEPGELDLLGKELEHVDYQLGRLAELVGELEEI